MKDYGSININLLERDTRREKALVFMTGSILIIAVVFGTMTGLYFYQHQLYAAQQRLNDQLQASIKNLQQEGPVPVGQKNLQADLTKKGNNIKQVVEKRQSYVDVLGEIENAMPASLMMYEIEFSDKKITLQGFAQEYSTEAQLLAGLRKSPVFKDVTLANSSLDDKSQQVLFKIDMDWEAGRK